jgi:DHA2 family multidrug resistance protein
MLIAFRIVQGLAGACLLPLGIATAFSFFPANERGTAMGVMGVALLLAPALGPTLGGYFVTYARWEWIFYINLPIGIVGIILAAIYLQESPTQRDFYFDAPGFIFAAGGLASLLYAFDSAGIDGWSAAKVHIFLVIGVCGLLILVPVELLTIRSDRQPLLDIRLFAIPTFTGPISPMS